MKQGVGLVEQHTSKGRVLVIEHDPGLSGRLTRALEKWGYTAFLAEDGQAAFRTVAGSSFDFDAILCGLHLPVVPGRLLLSRIRPLVQDVTPVIVVSAEAHLREPIVATEDWLFASLDDPDNLARIKHLVDEAVCWRFQRRAVAGGVVADLGERNIQSLVDEVERLYRQVRSDELTGLPTRLKLNEQFEWLSTSKRQFSGSFVVALLDVDRFREVNEACGYEGGDRVIAEFAALVRGQMREGDSLYRYGGDEFVALLQAEDVREGIIVMERIQRALADAPPIALGERAFQITFSAGVAISLTSFRPSLDGLLRKATRHLKDAKQAGGACVRPRVLSTAVQSAPQLEGDTRW